MGKTFVFDYDDTITDAPEQLSTISDALRAAGHKVVIVTGNLGPKSDLKKGLADLGFNYDDIIQYDHKPGWEGSLVRARIMDNLNAFCAVDNRVERASVYADVCPHLFLITKPSKDDKGDIKKDVKKGAKKALKRTLLVGGPVNGAYMANHGLSLDLEVVGSDEMVYHYKAEPTFERAFYVEKREDLTVPDANDVPLADPPNLRKADDSDESCSSCWMYDLVGGTCWRYHNKPVKLTQVCDSWEAGPSQART